MAWSPDCMGELMAKLNTAGKDEFGSDDKVRNAELGRGLLQQRKKKTWKRNCYVRSRTSGKDEGGKKK